MAKIDKNKFGEIALSLQQNIEAEAEALHKYQDMLNHLDNVLNGEWLFQVWDPEKTCYVPSDTAKADKKMIEFIKAQIKEYMSEELKHQKGLQTLYEAVTGLSAEK